MSQFRELSASDMQAVRGFTGESDLSYHQFTNMFMWRRVMNAKICITDRALYVYNRYQNHPPAVFFPFCKREDEEDCVRELLSLLPEVSTFRPVTEDQGKRLLAMFPGARMESIRSQWDYCYLASDLIALAGRKYHTKKNHLNIFKSAYSWQWHDVNADSGDEALALLRAASERLDLMRENEENGEPDVMPEHEANLELISHLRRFDLRAGVITADGLPIAYSVGERIGNDTALIHIEKADREYRGAYAAINQMLVASAFSDLTWINREEDMGIEGLRKAKESYRPAKMNEVFTVILPE